MYILIISNDSALVKVIQLFTEHTNCQVLHAPDNHTALSILSNYDINLTIADWNSGDINGHATLGLLHSKIGHRIPLIILATRFDEIPKTLLSRSLSIEFIIKPVSGYDLVKRVNAWLGNSLKSMHLAEFVRIGNYVLDIQRRQVSLRGKDISLTSKEFDLLLFMALNAGKTLSRQLISAAAWGRPTVSTSRTLDTHMYRLRRKLGLMPENGVILLAVYTSGYRLEAFRAYPGGLIPAESTTSPAPPWSNID
ncbi:response regulator transcription factor [Burkholderia latens]|uniref:Response regulator transcription factor n=1 Tax=Burkholderia latens TaxID=488446 RepID=A0A6H9TLX9_9BURK|nr:response regulator transcription factor [Burkholderia latens]KAB0644786.1 response regulator transcription factor [Burkholderia latens]VWB17527.1 two component transcriptional regulator [Burkholderia latens]